MCVIPGDFIVTPKPWVREGLLPKGSGVPRGNVLSVYLDACKQLQVSAISGVVDEINRRKCSMQPLPYHVLSGTTKAQKIQYVLSWVNFENTDGLSWKLFRHIVAIIAPLMTDEELATYHPPAEMLSMDQCEHILVSPPSGRDCSVPYSPAFAIMP
jgi:hypothetical protein